MPHLDSEEDVQMADADTPEPSRGVAASDAAQPSKDESSIVAEPVKRGTALARTERSTSSAEPDSESKTTKGNDVEKTDADGARNGDDQQRAASSKSAVQPPKAHPSGESKDVAAAQQKNDRAQTVDEDRLAKDQARLTQVLGEVSRKAVQNTLRENWRTMLFDPPDESHVAFILRAGLKNSSTGILSRVIKDDNVFKRPFIDAACQKPAIRRQVLETATTQELIDHLPVDKMHTLVGAMIETVDVKQLVIWLAKGNRLGFEEDDVRVGAEAFKPNVQVAGGQSPTQQQQPYHDAYPQQARPPPPHNLSPRLQQSSNGPPPPPHALQTLPSHPPPHHIPPIRSEFRYSHMPPPSHVLESSKPSETDALLQEQNRHRIQVEKINPDGPLICGDCNFKFQNVTGYQYHLTKKPCMKPPPPDGYRAICANCRQGFTTKQGNDYHQLKRVCLGEGDTFPSDNAVAPPGYMASVRAAQPSNDGLPRPSLPDVNVPVNPARPASGTILPPISSIHSLPSRPNHHADPAWPRMPQVPPPHAQPAMPVRIPASTTVPSNSTRKQAPRAPDDIRVDPSQLPPDRLAALNHELEEIDRKYEQGLAEIPTDWSESQKESKRQSLKNANASRKSQIRKSYGVSLRLRERDRKARDSIRMSMNAGSSSPPNASPTPSSNYRPRFDTPKTTSNSSPLAATPVVSGFSPVNAPRAAPPINSRIIGHTFHAYQQPRSSNTSGSSTPSSNLPSKRRHEGVEHERRLGGDQGVYTGSMPRSSALASVGSLHAASGPPTPDTENDRASMSKPSTPSRETMADKDTEQPGEKDRDVRSENDVKRPEDAKEMTNGKPKTKREVVDLSDSGSDVESIPAA